MGTRADFYVGRGESAEWLGSIAWDGYPGGIPAAITKPRQERSYRRNVAVFLASRSDATLPTEGWPWPWEDSRTTDCAYAWDDGFVYASWFGRVWFRADLPEPEYDETAEERPKACVFPQMDTSRFKAPGSRGSGMMMIDAIGLHSEE